MQDGPPSSRGRAATHATVTLPPLPRPPGGAVRTPPVPPPRPESTLSARSTLSQVMSGPGRGGESPPSSITLTAPRPGAHRAQNLYVDAPLKAVTNQPTTRRGLPQKQPRLSSRGPVKTPSVIPGGTLKKPAPSPETSSVSSDSSDSIICRECGRCKCEACRQPRPLPQRWVCGETWLCSAQNCVDTLSCMCCVRALFYHCGKDPEEVGIDKPCSCSADHVNLRWGALSLLSVVMPCLLCYLPLKGCVRATEALYQKATANGCRCEPATNNNEATVIATVKTPVPSPADSQKRLLG